MLFTAELYSLMNANSSETVQVKFLCMGIHTGNNLFTVRQGPIGPMALCMRFLLVNALLSMLVLTCD